MNFELDTAQREILKAAREFAKGEFDRDRVQELEKESRFPEEVWRKAADLGFIGIHFDEAVSGGGMGVLENALLAEAFCRQDSSLGSALMLAGHGAECPLRFGDEDQKARWPPAVAEGRTRCGAALWEPNGDADPGAVTTTALKDGGGWRLTGTKQFVINGGAAGLYIVLARTDPEADAAAGLSMFVVAADVSGVSWRSQGEKLGTRMVPLATLELADVKLPAGSLVGREGRGLAQAEAFLAESRLSFAAMALGTARGALDRALDYSRQREQFGRKLAKFEVTAHKLADMTLQVELARLITHEAAWRFDAGRPDERLICLARLQAGQAAVAVADEAVQLLGGYGYMQEYEVEHFYRDAKALDLFAGPRGAEKNRVAAKVIGKIKAR